MTKETRRNILIMTFIFVFMFSVSIVAQEFNEAPSLKELVDEGELPPVDERLSEDVKELEPFEEIGEYGGTVRRAFLGPTDFLAYGKFATSDGLVRYAPDPKEGIVPCLAKDWEWGPDKKEITFYLREGLKWSDGEPYTADDIAFEWNEIQHNSEIAEEAPMMIGGEEVEFEKIDDYTIKYKFPETYVFALEQLFRFVVGVPSHYYKQFHPEYNEEIDDWELFREKIVELESPYFDLERPVMQAWKIENRKEGDRFVAKRNPYYWKVDPEGNQLPYIDEVVMEVAPETDTYPLKVMNGEIDVQFRYINFADFTLLKENEEEGDYNVITPVEARGGPSFYLNWDTPKEDLKEYIRNKDFRIALSNSINREEINEVLYHGTQEIQNYSFAPGSEYFDEELFVKNAEYNPDKAKETFNDLGLEDKNGDGILQYDNGDKVTIVIWVRQGLAEHTNIAEIVAKQWRDVGINTEVHAVERSILYTQCTEPEGPEHDVVIWHIGGASTPLKRENRWAATGELPGGEVAWWQASANRWWHTDGEEGEEPDPGIKEIQELWHKAQKETDPEKRREMADKINKLHVENVYNIGTTTRATIGIVKKNLKNVPEDFIFGNFSQGLAITRPEQFYYSN